MGSVTGRPEVKAWVEGQARMLSLLGCIRGGIAMLLGAALARTPWERPWLGHATLAVALAIIYWPEVRDGISWVTALWRLGKKIHTAAQDKARI